MYQEINYKTLKPCNYNRKSSESEDKQVLSIISQKDEAERIAKFYNLPKFVEVFSESKSAKKEFLRPEFKRMIEMIKKEKIDSIVCWKLDRLARNMTEGGIVIDLLSSGVLKAIITHDKIYRPSDNVLLMSVEFGQGKQFVKDLSVNVKRGQLKKATLGIPHGVAALGFLNDKTEERGNRKWLVDEERLKSIKLLLEMFLTGTYSAGRLYRYAVKELKLTTVKRKRIGGELITLSRIYEILKDPVYAGFFYYNGERFELDKKLPRLITEDEHEKVQMILSKKNIPKSQHHSTIFAGFLRSENGEFIGQDVKYQLICDCKYKFSYLNKTHCPNCGREIEQLDNPKYLHFKYYYNVRKKKAGLKYKSISEKKVFSAVFRLIDEDFTFSKSLIEWSKKYISELRDEELNDLFFRKAKMEADKIEFEKKKTRLREMLRDELINESEYKSDLEILGSRYKFNDNEAKIISKYSRFNEIADLTATAKEVMETGSIQAKRELLSKLGSNLVWDGEKLLIYNDKAIDKLINGIKGIKSKFPEFEPKNYQVPQGLNRKNRAFDPIFSTLLRAWEDVRKDVKNDREAA